MSGKIPPGLSGDALPCAAPMGLFTHVDAAGMAEIAARFQLGPVRAFEGVEAGTVNSNYRLHAAQGDFFVRVNEGKSEDDVAYEAELVRYLAGRGVATAAPQVAADGRPYARVTVGEISCSAQTVPVIIDNRVETTSATAFEILVFDKTGTHGGTALVHVAEGSKKVFPMSVAHIDDGVVVVYENAAVDDPHVFYAGAFHTSCPAGAAGVVGAESAAGATGAGLAPTGGAGAGPLTVAIGLLVLGSVAVLASRRSPGSSPDQRRRPGSGVRMPERWCCAAAGRRSRTSLETGVPEGQIVPVRHSAPEAPLPGGRR